MPRIVCKFTPDDQPKNNEKYEYEYKKRKIIDLDNVKDADELKIEADQRRLDNLEESVISEPRNKPRYEPSYEPIKKEIRLRSKCEMKYEQDKERRREARNKLWK